MQEIHLLALQLIAESQDLNRLRALAYSDQVNIVINNTQQLFDLYREQINSTIRKEQIENAYIQASLILESSQQKGINALAPNNRYFPMQLRNIDEPPLILFVKGKVEVLTQGLLIAVVGSRQLSDYGAEIAFTISNQLAEQNIAVVSGLAEGVDARAHLGCLHGKGKTIAVLAHGLDMIYPAQHGYIAEQIIRYGGCLVSEYPIDAKPQRYTFVRRNRLQSGLSAGVVVVECQADSGTMHTARFCIQQKRLLGCIDFTPKYLQPTGNNLLFKQGAFCIRGSEDLRGYLIEIKKKFSFSSGAEVFTQDKIATTSQAAASYQNPPVTSGVDLSSQHTVVEENPFLVPSYNERFVGRLKWLAKIREIIGIPSINSIPPKVLITGIGGCGKTELAIKYAWEDRHLYPGGCFFINCDSKFSIRDSLVGIAKHISLSVECVDDSTYMDLFQTLREKGRTLLIYDNVMHEQLEQLKQFMPPENIGLSSAHFTVILTSRSQIMSLSFTEAIILDPNEESLQQDALEYTHKCLGENRLNQLLIEKVEYLSLGLSQAIAYIHQHPTMTIVEYCSLFEQVEKKGELLSQAPREGGNCKETKVILTTWTLALDSLRRNIPTSLDVITVCAFLASGNIDKRWFINKYPDIDSILSVLLQYGLIYINKNKPSTFKIHRLLQEVIIMTLQGNKLAYIIDGFRHLATTKEPYTRDNADIYSILSEHVTMLMEKFSKERTVEPIFFSEEISNLFLNVGLYNKDYLLDYRRAKDFLHMSYNIILFVNSMDCVVDQHLKFRAALHLAKLYICNNNLDLAEPLLRKAESLVTTSNQTNEVLFAKEQLYRAKHEYDSALAIREKLLQNAGLDIKQKARCLHNAASELHSTYKGNCALIKIKQQQLKDTPQWQTMVKGRIEEEAKSLEDHNNVLLQQAIDYLHEAISIKKTTQDIFELARTYMLLLTVMMEKMSFYNQIIPAAVDMYDICASFLKENRFIWYRKLIILLSDIYSNCFHLVEGTNIGRRFSDIMLTGIKDFEQDLILYNSLQAKMVSRQRLITSYFQPVSWSPRQNPLDSEPQQSKKDTYKLPEGRR